MTTARALTLALLCLATTACHGLPTAAKKPATLATSKSLPTVTPAGLTAVAPADTIVLTGSVMAGGGIVAAGGGNIVAAGGGNVISSGGGSIVAAGGGNLAPQVPMLGAGLRQLLDISESPLAGAQVFLAHPDGTALDGSTPATADAQGQFKLPSVPTGGTVVLAVKVKTKAGKDALMESLAVPSKDSTGAAIAVETTLVARAMLDGVTGKPGLVDVGAWVDTVHYCQKQLKPGNWPDLSDQAAITTWMDGLAKDDSTVATKIDRIKSTLRGGQ